MWTGWRDGLSHHRTHSRPPKVTSARFLGLTCICGLSLKVVMVGMREPISAGFPSQGQMGFILMTRLTAWQPLGRTSGTGFTHGQKCGGRKVGYVANEARVSEARGDRRVSSAERCRCFCRQPPRCARKIFRGSRPEDSKFALHDDDGHGHGESRRFPLQYSYRRVMGGATDAPL